MGWRHLGWLKHMGFENVTLTYTFTRKKTPDAKILQIERHCTLEKFPPWKCWRILYSISRCMTLRTHRTCWSFQVLETAKTNRRYPTWVPTTFFFDGYFQSDEGHQILGNGSFNQTDDLFGDFFRWPFPSKNLEVTILAAGTKGERFFTIPNKGHQQNCQVYMHHEAGKVKKKNSSSKPTFLPLPTGLSMAYKWGWSKVLIIWDGPPSAALGKRTYFLSQNPMGPWALEMDLTRAPNSNNSSNSSCSFAIR